MASVAPLAKRCGRGRELEGVSTHIHSIRNKKVEREITPKVLTDSLQGNPQRVQEGTWRYQAIGFLG